MTRLANASFFRRSPRNAWRSAVDRPDKYWRARPVSEAGDVTSEVRDQNRRALRQRHTKVTSPENRGSGLGRLSRPSASNPTRRWAPLLAFFSVSSMALVIGIPSFAASESRDDAAFQRSAKSDQTVTGSAANQAIQRDGVSAMAGYGRPGGPSLASFTNNPNGTIQWPFSSTVPISDLFGQREAPCSGCSTMHGGVDFDAGEGHPIQSIADGVVTRVQPFDDNGDGMFVEISHNINGQSILSRYCHLLPDSIVVSEGQSVGVTQLVAQVGNTGATTGPHLHFEIHVDGSPVDPYAWLIQHAN